MKLPTIYLLRHGQTEWNAEGRYQGQLNSPLTALGREQAKRNGQKLKKHIDIKEIKLFSSPLGRAEETATIIMGILEEDSSNIIFDKRLQEVDYGIFEGKTKQFCKTELKAQFEAREANKWDYVLEGGESYEMVTKRLNEWIETIQDEKVIVVVAHEMINRALRGIYLNLKRDKILKLRQPNDMLIKLEKMGELILE